MTPAGQAGRWCRLLDHEGTDAVDPEDRARWRLVRRTDTPYVPRLTVVRSWPSEPMEPDLETLRVSQAREVSPGEEECLLDGVSTWPPMASCAQRP
jgi:hypothetical protein